MRMLIGIALTTSLWISNAAADGETTPMFGAGVVVGTSTQQSSLRAGGGLEAAWWWGWLGFAVEASGHSAVDGDESRTMIVGGSLRIRVLQRVLPSLLEPSDVELGVELQGIVERTWWDRSDSDAEPTRRGLGIAVRLRGGSDDAPRVITESRFFVRALSWRAGMDEHVARTTMPPSHDARELMVLVGVGAAFGGGEPRYLEQFRRRGF